VCIDTGTAVEAGIGKEYAKMTMAASIRKQVRKVGNESESVFQSPARLLAGVDRKMVSRSAEDVDVHHRVERAAVVSMESLPSDEKRSRENSLVAPLAVNTNTSDVVSTKSKSSHKKRNRQDSLVAPLTVDVSHVNLKLVSHFSLFTYLCFHALNLHNLHVDSET